MIQRYSPSTTLITPVSLGSYISIISISKHKLFTNAVFYYKSCIVFTFSPNINEIILKTKVFAIIQLLLSIYINCIQNC